MSLRHKINDDMGPLPQVPERHDPVANARNELYEFLLSWRHRHGLSVSEELSVVAKYLNDQLQYCVQTERRKSDG